MDTCTTNSPLEYARTVEEEFALISEARPSSTKYKVKWAVEIFLEWQRTRTLKFPDLEVGSVFKHYDFHLVCSVEDNLKHMDALSFNLWLARFIQEMANKKGSRYPPTLHGIVCGLKRHLEEAKSAPTFSPLDYKDKR